jgi:hypothetical protein
VQVPQGEILTVAECFVSVPSIPDMDRFPHPATIVQIPNDLHIVGWYGTSTLIKVHRNEVCG